VPVGQIQIGAEEKAPEYALKSGKGAVILPHINGSGGPQPACRPQGFRKRGMMIPGFERIVEERIRQAQQKGEFDRLEGRGKPLALEEDANVPDELRIAYKILKNADMLPPELELRNEIRQTEDLLAAMPDTAEKFRLTKKLNFMIMRFNTMRQGSAEFEVPQHYAARLMDRVARGGTDTGGK
jgi:hypothetical protein